ncbi:MAG: MBOAT family protein [Deltaproteobacteria bacterium]|nr:MAG: MBOAT family protein [Deltaproteobacteria bacterium]
MLFPTYTFLYFLLVVVVGRWLLPRRAVLPFLLAASYVFYLSWGPIYGLLLAGTTVVTWFLGQLIERDPRYKKLWLVTGLVASLGTLAFFKYAAFLVQQVYALAGLVDDAVVPPEIEIVLPLGVSFFLFQMISYLVDVYRGAPSEPSLSRYALYITFFPQLVAGPIVRGGELLPQFDAIATRPLSKGPLAPRAFDPDRFAAGIDLLLRGFLKKVVIADNLAAWSDVVFKTPGAYDTLATWVGVLAYAGQIYGDFSGYTDMARGAGKMLGFELPDNFALPYLSRSITEFWRRWHMTLSRWLRDYLYIPLGGNRCGRVRRYLNLVITMGLGGLWHGANWTFVIWGLYHGLLLILHKAWLHLTGPTLIGRHRPSFLYGALAMAGTFFLVVLGWIVFRAPDVDTAFTVMGHLFDAPAVHTGPRPDDMVRAMWFLGALAGAHYLGAARWPKRLWAALPPPLRGLAWAGGILACYVFAGRPATFIYFQF